MVVVVSVGALTSRLAWQQMRVAGLRGLRPTFAAAAAASRRHAEPRCGGCGASFGCGQAARSGRVVCVGPVVTLLHRPLPSTRGCFRPITRCRHARDDGDAQRIARRRRGRDGAARRLASAVRVLRLPLAPPGAPQLPRPPTDCAPPSHALHELAERGRNGARVTRWRKEGGFFLAGFFQSFKSRIFKFESTAP